METRWSRVDPDLVRAPRAQLRVHQAVTTETLLQADDSMRTLAVGSTLTRRSPLVVHLDRLSLMLAVVDPIALRPAPGSASRLALAQHGMQGQQRVALLGDHGRPEVSRSSRWTSSRNFACGRAAQLLDHAKRHAAAAVDRHAGGLVDHQHGVVLVDHRKLGGRHGQARRDRAASGAECGRCRPRPPGSRPGYGPCLPAPRRRGSPYRCASWARLCTAAAGNCPGVGRHVRRRPRPSGRRGLCRGGSFFAHCGKRHIIGTARG